MGIQRLNIQGFLSRRDVAGKPSRTVITTLVCLVVASPARAGPPEAARVATEAPAEPEPSPPQYRQPPSVAPVGSPRRGRMLMIVGWSVFGGTYALTATLGIILHNSTRICDASGDSCRRPGLPMLIPIVGPLFLVRDYAETESGPLVTASTMLFQSASLAAAIAGTVLYVRDGKRRRLGEPQAGLDLGHGVRLRAAPRLDGGMLQLSYRF
jgi:hypothetical protein